MPLNAGHIIPPPILAKRMTLAPAMTIKLVRHGQSLANTHEALPHVSGDAGIGLTALGKQQAIAVGESLGSDYLTEAVIYTSPYERTRATTTLLLQGAGLENTVKVYEDPRLREAERGYTEEGDQFALRKIHGWFYYRHTGGESAADCYDRTSAFLESMMRGAQRRRAQRFLIVAHGMTIRCFVMRFLHLTVEQFVSMADLGNCDIVTIAPIAEVKDPVFQTARWGVTGLKLRQAAPR